MAKMVATRDAYGKALLELGKEDRRIVVLDADLYKSTRTNFFAEAFPERFFDLGITEQNMMGTAAGLAMTGKIPFANSFAVFATGRAFDQIRQSVAYPKLNVKIAGSSAGLTVGADGATHQSVEDIAIMRAIPNMTVVVPADGIETEKATKAIAKYGGPVYLRLGRYDLPLLYDESYEFQLGKAVTMREGRDVTIIATGVMVSRALEAADQLAKRGVDTRVVNIHTIKPIDEEAIFTAAKETGAIVTAEEHNIFGGLGSAVAEVVTKYYPVPIERVGIKDSFGESATAEELLMKYGLTSEDIVDAVEKILLRRVKR